MLYKYHPVLKVYNFQRLKWDYFGFSDHRMISRQKALNSLRMIERLSRGKGRNQLVGSQRVKPSNRAGRKIQASQISTLHGLRRKIIRKEFPRLLTKQYSHGRVQMGHIRILVVPFLNFQFCTLQEIKQNKLDNLVLFYVNTITHIYVSIQIHTFASVTYRCKCIHMFSAVFH